MAPPAAEGQMKFQVLSDLHLELHADGGAELLASMDACGADVLVVAGDLSSRHLLEQSLGSLCERFAHVVYVTGNHEYYGSSRDLVHRVLARLSRQLANLHWLHETVVELGDTRVICNPFGYPQEVNLEFDPRRVVEVQRCRARPRSDWEA